jgi:hypothetical protein
MRFERVGNDDFGKRGLSEISCGPGACSRAFKLLWQIL